MTDMQCKIFGNAPKLRQIKSVAGQMYQYIDCHLECLKMLVFALLELSFTYHQVKCYSLFIFNILHCYVLCCVQKYTQLHLFGTDESPGTDSDSSVNESHERNTILENKVCTM